MMIRGWVLNDDKRIFIECKNHCDNDNIAFFVVSSGVEELSNIFE